MSVLALRGLSKHICRAESSESGYLHFYSPSKNFSWIQFFLYSVFFSLLFSSPFSSELVPSRNKRFNWLPFNEVAIQNLSSVFKSSFGGIKSVNTSRDEHWVIRITESIAKCSYALMPLRGQSVADFYVVQLHISASSIFDTLISDTHIYTGCSIGGTDEIKVEDTTLSIPRWMTSYVVFLEGRYLR